MARAAIYTRISTASQEENTSLEIQHREGVRYAEGRGYEVVAVYREVFSGAELRRRPELSRLRETIRRGEVDVVVVYRSDRLSRDQDDRVFLRSEGKQYGVRYESVRDPSGDSDEDRLVEYIRGYASGLERRRIQERMQDGLDERIRAGALNPGGHPLYGYQYDDPGKKAKRRYVENPAQSWVVRRVFREADAGKPIRAIARGLNEEGVPTPKGGREWYPRSVWSILRNTAYKGEVYANVHRFEENETTGRKTKHKVRPREEWIAIPNAAPALVDTATWQRVNDRLANNRAEYNRPHQEATDALLRAGFVLCGHCGHRMYVRRQPGGAFYTCQSESKGAGQGCGYQAIRATELDRWVWGFSWSLLSDPGVRAHEMQRGQPNLVESLQEQLRLYDGRLEAIGREQRNLARLAGSAERADVTEPLLERLRELAGERAGIESERRTAETQIEAGTQTARAVRTIWDELETFIRESTTWDYGQKREALRRLGVQVTVWRPDAGRPRFDVKVAPPWPRGVEFIPAGPRPNVLSEEESRYAEWRIEQDAAREPYGFSRRCGTSGCRWRRAGRRWRPGSRC